MNELFLSGTILNLVKTPTTGDTSHVVCQLRHSHRNRQQQVIHETYTVHAWDRLADWAVQTLKPGARVYVKGYLTQKLRGDVVMTEVTAAQFFVQNPAGMDAENQLASEYSARDCAARPLKLSIHSGGIEHACRRR